MTTFQSAPLGKLLIETGALSQAKLDEVLAEQKSDRRRLGELLVEKGLVHPQRLAQILSHQLSCPWISLARMDIAPSVLALVSGDVALAHEVVPVHLRTQRGAQVLYIATSDPTDEAALAACTRACGLPVRAMVAVTSEIRAALTRYYGGPAPYAPPPPDSTDVILDDGDLVAIEETPSTKPTSASILVLNAPARFLEQCRASVAGLDAIVVDGSLMEAGDLVAKTKPCAIVVTEDVYAFDRSGINRLALDNDTVLVVWSEDVEGKQLEPLLGGAVKRWRRGAYEKGAILDGRYELVRDLGGPVAAARWEARHMRTGRRSILHVATQGDSAGVRHQQAALARVSHPGALDLRDAGTTDRGDAYVVLETLEGKSLEGLLAARGKMAPEVACSVVLQVADVLAEAHAADVLHRDVRPENVILVRDGYGIERTKLVGWHAAKVANDDIDPQIDLAALGVCAFEALVGRARYSDEENDTGGLASDLASAVNRAVDGGFASIAEFSAALEHAVPGARRPSKLLGAAMRDRGSAAGAAPEEITAIAQIAEPAPPPPPPAPVEERRYARAPYRTPVRVEVPGIGAVDGRSEDISARGLLIVTRGSIPLGTIVTVRFALPVDGRVVAESGAVKWSRAARLGEGAEATRALWAIGVELAAPTAETTKQVERYVALMGDGDTASRS